MFIRTDNVFYPGSTKMKKNMVYVLYKCIGYGEKTERRSGSDHIENPHEVDTKYCFFLHQVLSLLRGTEGSTGISNMSSLRVIQTELKEMLADPTPRGLTNNVWGQHSTWIDMHSVLCLPSFLFVILLVIKWEGKLLLVDDWESGYSRVKIMLLLDMSSLILL